MLNINNNCSDLKFKNKIKMIIFGVWKLIHLSMWHGDLHHFICSQMSLREILNFLKSPHYLKKYLSTFVKKKIFNSFRFRLFIYFLRKYRENLSHLPTSHISNVRFDWCEFSDLSMFYVLCLFFIKFTRGIPLSLIVW